MTTCESRSWKSTKEPRGKSMANCHPKQIAVCKLWNLNYPSRIKVQDCEKLKMPLGLGNGIWIKNIITKLNCTPNLPLSWHLNCFVILNGPNSLLVRFWKFYFCGNLKNYMAWSLYLGYVGVKTTSNRLFFLSLMAI